MANTLLNLPQELRIQILSHLDAVSLVRCAMTCKSVNATLKNSSLLSYTIQLHFDGLSGVATGTATTHSKLIESLLRRRQAWLSLDCTGYTSYSMRYTCRAYELVGGVFANTDRHHLQLSWLPTCGNLEGRTIQRSLTGISVRDFTIDPAQDMIALLEDDGSPPSKTDARTCRIHIRTISTDATHPLAQQGVLDFLVLPNNSYPNSFDNGIASVYLEIAKNILVAVLTLDAIWRRKRVLVWDWTTSDLIMDSSISFDSMLPSRSSEFAILNSTSCLVTSTTGSGSIQLYKLVRSQSNRPKAIHLVTLHLPPTVLSTEVTKIYTYAGPTEAQPLSHTPFIANDEDRLHVLTVLYTHPLIDSEMNIFVHQRVFTRYISRQISSPEGDLPLDISWEEWGPPHTKIIHPACVDEGGWVRYIHGQRVVLSERISEHIHDASGGPGEVSYPIVVLDFSLAAVLSAKGAPIPVSPSSPASSQRNPGSLLPSSIIRAQTIPLFDGDVKTYLPCVSYKRELKQTYLAHMIHADGIVGVNIQDDGSLLLHAYTI